MRVPSPFTMTVFVWATATSCTYRHLPRNRGFRYATVCPALECAYDSDLYRLSGLDYQF